MIEDSVSIKLSDIVADTVDARLISSANGIGIYLLCGGRIFSAVELILEIDHHLCAEAILAIHARLFDFSGDAANSAMNFGLQVVSGWLLPIELEHIPYRYKV